MHVCKSTWTVVKSTPTPSYYLLSAYLRYVASAFIVKLLYCSGRSKCNKMWTDRICGRHSDNLGSLVRLASWCGCQDHVVAPLPTLARDSGNNSHYLIRYLIWKRQLYYLSKYVSSQYCPLYLLINLESIPNICVFHWQLHYVEVVSIFQPGILRSSMAQYDCTLYRAGGQV